MKLIEKRVRAAFLELRKSWVCEKYVQRIGYTPAQAREAHARNNALERLLQAGWVVKNIDDAGNVRFFNSHSCGYPESSFEPDLVWIDNADLIGIAEEVGDNE